MRLNLCRQMMGGQQQQRPRHIFTEQECLQYMSSQNQVCMMDSSVQEERINVEFMKLGVRGMTILTASGDGGSHFSFGRFPESEKEDPLGLGRALNRASCLLNSPTFPASSPYVTAVGGTSWKDSGNNNIMQPITWIASGSGFSWRFARPDYQHEAVEQYLKLNMQTPNFPKPNTFNISGRAYPDLAALAENVPIIMNGRALNVGGTSASTPTWGGIFSMINDQRIARGLPPLGFVNPALYNLAREHPGEAFQDITEGTSACAYDRSCCDSGFPAARRWDPRPGWDRQSGLVL